MPNNESMLTPAPVEPQELAEAVAELEWRREYAGTTKDGVPRPLSISQELARTLIRAARAPRLTGEQRDFVTDCDELVAAWDWWREDTYDGSMSVVSDAIEEVRKSRIAFAADLAGEVDRG